MSVREKADPAVPPSGVRSTSRWEDRTEEMVERAETSTSSVTKTGILYSTSPFSSISMLVTVAMGWGRTVMEKTDRTLKSTFLWERCSKNRKQERYCSRFLNQRNTCSSKGDVEAGETQDSKLLPIVHPSITNPGKKGWNAGFSLN